MAFTPKSRQQILTSMVAKIAAETPITDFTDGSVILTLLEAAAQEDFQQYVQMLQIIRNYNLDTTEGEDLDKRAAEFGLTRLRPQRHSGFVNISDSRFTKISSKLYAGLPGPTAGSFTLNVDDASSFPSSGSVYIGRGTSNSEGPIAYSAAPVNNGAFWTITLDTQLNKDHGTDETVILSQFGVRTIDAGTETQIPESDVSEQILFELNQNVELLDGEDSIDNVLVTALEPGGFEVPANSIQSFVSEPFTGAEVTNPLPFVNGRDEESDQELRDRIRDTIQSLSRGTSRAIRTNIVGLIDEDTNSSVVSANVIPPVQLADGPTRVFIDNGRGLEPSLTGVGLETVLSSATGGEVFLQLDNFPVVKANVISQNVAPFSLSGSETLVIRVGTSEETFTFLASDFESTGNAEATEVAEAINDRANLVEARTITESDGTKVILTPVANTNENLQIDDNSTAQSAFNFSTLEVLTLKLYKNDVLLTKDGRTASLLSNAQPFDLSTTTTTTTDGDITVTAESRIVTKSAAGSFPFDQFVHPGDYIKFDGDSDLFYAQVRTVVSETKLILEDDYLINGGGTGDILIWNSPQLEVAANGDRDETEIVSFAPTDFSNASQALASEVLSRLEKEIDLSEVEDAVDGTRIRIVSSTKNSSDSKLQILGGQGAISLGFSSATALSGTLDFTGGSKVVNGTGTSFLSELQEGQWIKGNSDNNGAWTKIESIENDTTLYLVENYRGRDLTGEASQAIEFSDLQQGSTRDYTFNRSNGQIELEEPATAGDRFTAGSINTRAQLLSNPETFDFDALGSSSNLIVCIDGGVEGTVTTGDASAPYDTFEDSSLVDFGANIFNGFYIEWVSGNNKGETDTVSSYNETTGEIQVTSGFTNPVVIGDKFILCQSIELTHSNFADPEVATAQEVADELNRTFIGGTAEVEGTTVRIFTNSFESTGKIQVKGGNANNLLGFSTDEQVNQISNTANVRSQNSDRESLDGSRGFSLGPGQNIIVILDEDNANKTFSVDLSVESTTTAGGTGTFTDSSITSDYGENDFFKDFFVYWTGGSNAGSVQLVDSYNGSTGAFTVSDIFPSTVGAISSGDTYSLVPRTSENVVAILNNFNKTTFSISGEAVVTEVTGDKVQLSTKTPGSEGKVFVTGGTANGFGILVQSIPAGSPSNDLNLNSRTGLSEGLLTSLTVDGEVTTGDSSVPYDTFIDTSMISSVSGAFTGLRLEFLSGNNEGFSTTINSYNETTGEIVLTDATDNPIAVGDDYRIFQDAYITSISGTSAPFTVTLNDTSNNPIDVSVYTTDRSAAVRDKNGLNFDTNQVEGIDGYKYFTGLIQKTQFTIDGLDRDPQNFPGFGAAGTQFEVLTPALVKIQLTVNVTTEEGTNLSSISNLVSSEITGYINSLDVGQDVILSEIIAAAQSVDGVFDVEIENLSSNVVIADGELARIDVEDLTIG